VSKTALKVAQLAALRSLFLAGIIATLVALVWSPTTAFANAVASTSPTVGSVLTVAPNAVSVTATGSLLDQGNSIMVTDPSGNEVDDGSLTISDVTAVIGLKPLTASGIYTVSYSLLSATDAPLTGSFTFLFNAPSTLSSPSATPTQPASSSSSKPVKPAGTSSSATVAVIILFVIATLVALFLVWYARMIWVDTKNQKRRKKRATPVKKSQE
jgi:methionine-rich copper-binding protein CopC